MRAEYHEMNSKLNGMRAKTEEKLKLANYNRNNLQIPVVGPFNSLRICQLQIKT